MRVGYYDGGTGPRLLTLQDQAIADAALAGKPEPYRRLDTAVLEALVLKRRARHDRGRHLPPARARLRARRPPQARERVDAGEADAAFFMRATPVEQVRDVAAAGENMPPKSTYFFPKVLDGDGVQSPQED